MKNKKSLKLGRRTGVNILQNKNIRRENDGTDNFNDYWTDSSKNSVSDLDNSPSKCTGNIISFNDSSGNSESQDLSVQPFLTRSRSSVPRKCSFKSPYAVNTSIGLITDSPANRSLRKRRLTQAKSIQTTLKKNPFPSTSDDNTRSVSKWQSCKKSLNFNGRGFEKLHLERTMVDKKSRIPSDSDDSMEFTDKHQNEKIAHVTVHNTRNAKLTFVNENLPVEVQGSTSIGLMTDSPANKSFGKRRQTFSNLDGTEFEKTNLQSPHKSLRKSASKMPVKKDSSMQCSLEVHETANDDESMKSKDEQHGKEFTQSTQTTVADSPASRSLKKRSKNFQPRRPHKFLQKSASKMSVKKDSSMQCSLEVHEITNDDESMKPEDEQHGKEIAQSTQTTVANSPASRSLRKRSKIFQPRNPHKSLQKSASKMSVRKDSSMQCSPEVHETANDVESMKSKDEQHGKEITQSAQTTVTDSPGSRSLRKHSKNFQPRSVQRLLNFDKTYLEKSNLQSPPKSSKKHASKLSLQKDSGSQSNAELQENMEVGESMESSVKEHHIEKITLSASITETDSPANMSSRKHRQTYQARSPQRSLNFDKPDLEKSNAELQGNTDVDESAESEDENHGEEIVPATLDSTSNDKAAFDKENVPDDALNICTEAVGTGKVPKKRGKQKMAEMETTYRRERPSRNRIPPLERWRGERRVFGFRKSGGIVDLGIDPGMKEDRTALDRIARRQVDKRKKKQKKVNNRVPHPESHSTSGESAVFVDSTTGTELQLQSRFKNLKWTIPSSQSSNNPSYKVCHSLWSEKVSFGFVEIGPGCSKSEQYSPDSSLHFVVLEGKLLFQIKGTQYRLSVKDSISVPVATAYSIDNNEHKTAVLHFCSSSFPFYEV